MRDPVSRGQRVRAGMRGPKHRLFDRQPAVERAKHHPGPRVQVVGVVEHHFVVPVQQAPPLARETVGQRRPPRGHCRLDRMRDGVESRGGGHVGRLRQGQLRIEHCDPERRRRVAARHLDAGRGVGHHRVALRFAAGAGGRRDADHRQQRPRRLAVSPIVFHPAAVGEQKVDALGAVHRTAATQADDGVDRVRTGGRAPGVDHGGIGIHIELVESHGGDAGPREQSFRQRHVSGLDQTVVRHEQRAPEPQLRGDGAEAPDRAAAEHQPRAGLKLERGQRFASRPGRYRLGRRRVAGGRMHWIRPHRVSPYGNSPSAQRAAGAAGTAGSYIQSVGLLGPVHDESEPRRGVASHQVGDDVVGPNVIGYRDPQQPAGVRIEGGVP